jgi:hypothetical protein
MNAKVCATLANLDQAAFLWFADSEFAQSWRNGYCREAKGDLTLEGITQSIRGASENVMRVHKLRLHPFIIRIV